ncbi:MAG TPA: hypothetical protein VG095_06150, partial [Chthoniobacterales bacterium]|nr:hypothetical protein [Chthoniobacterales bacterium]
GPVAANDDWRANEAEILATGLAPRHDRESAIVRTLQPGSYTAVVRGFSGTTGVALVEIYDVEQSSTAGLANISTRGFVQTGENVMIGGVIVQGGPPMNLLVRARGPSLSNDGVPTVLLNPVLELFNAQGSVIASNDDWRQSQEAQIRNTGLAPSVDSESALLQSLAPGSYTAILRGSNSTTGNAIFEVFTVN